MICYNRDFVLGMVASFGAGAVGGIMLVGHTEQYETGINIDAQTRVSAQQARMTAENVCVEQEKMSRRLQGYFDGLSKGAVSDEKLAAKNPDFTITKEECLNLLQERQQRSAALTPAAKP